MAKSLDIIDPKKELGNDSPRDDEKEERMVRASQPMESSSGGVFYLVIGIIAVIVSASLALYILFKDNKTTNTPAAVASVTATADSSVSPSASTTASVTSSASTSATLSPAESTSGTTSAFKYTNEQIRIANGNNIAGEGAKIKTLLESKGFKIASVGNATKQYDSSIIYYKTGQEQLATALKTALVGSYNATIENSDSTVGSYDAVVVLGAK